MSLPLSFKKPIGAYIKEAKAVERHDPIMAYFCRMYAMQEAIPIMDSDPGGKEYLTGLMVQLEGDKSDLEASGADLADKKHPTEFALKVFAAADREDRAGKANQQTARTFLAAATFFNVLQQFGELPNDLIEMRKYAKFKAAGILKAIREGRTPQAGGPMSAEEKELNAMMALDAAALPDPDDTPMPETPVVSNDDPTVPDADDSDPFSSGQNVNADDYGADNVATTDDLDDDALNAMLGSLPSVPSIGDSSSSIPPPSYDEPSAGGSSSSNSSNVNNESAADVSDAAAEALALMKAEYEATKQAEHEEMMRLHLAQEQQIAKLQTMLEASMKNKPAAATPAPTTIAPPQQTVSIGGGAGGALARPRPLAQIDTAMAMKHARFIASALQYEDIPTAFKELKLVAKLLTHGDLLKMDLPEPQ